MAKFTGNQACAVTVGEGGKGTPRAELCSQRREGGIQKGAQGEGGGELAQRAATVCCKPFSKPGSEGSQEGGDKKTITASQDAACHTHWGTWTSAAGQ